MIESIRIARVPFAPNYLVSEDWRLFRELAPSDDGKGYLRADLPHDGKAHYPVRMNRIVAGAFLPPPEPGQYLVRHLDGNRRHNHASNLAWGTDQDNSDDACGHVIGRSTGREETP